MEILLYALIFITGTVFGSFFTLAVYRIPLGKDITHEHSFCTNCNHKLGILDLIPVLSYIFLKGKCRYCGEKIRIRYLLLEILSGFVFLLFALSLHINLFTLEVSKIVYLLFGILYFCSLFIMAGIDKEKHTIQKSLLIYGIVVVTTYILYLYIVENANVYRYVIYLFLMLVCILVDTFYLRKKANSNYTLQILTLCIYMTLFSGEILFGITVVTTLLIIGFKLLNDKVTRMNRKYIKTEKTLSSNLPIGFYLCVSNIAMLIIANVLCNYVYINLL